MPLYRVLLTRTRTVTEHALVKVNSSGAHYAQRDARQAATGLWQEDASKFSEIEMLSCVEIDCG